MTSILPATAENIVAAGRRLQQGRLVAFATETVYGLGADALNPAAVAAVFETKQRPLYDPLIVHVAGVAAAQLLCARWPPIAQQLAARFWPGPLTLVLPRGPEVPDLVTAGLPNVAIRWPAHPVAQALLAAAQCPIAAPSANRFAGISPTSAADVAAELPDADLWILDGGPCQHGLESTVVSVVNPQPVVLRLGSLSVEELSAEVGPLDVALRSVNPEDLQAGLAAPGNLQRHYAPRTPLRVVSRVPRRVRHVGRIGLLCFAQAEAAELRSGFTCVEDLSPQGCLTEAAANLYAALRRLDHADLEQIVALKLPDHGLGRAINDRLQRASH
jgi:L-threonylcarbamoyladenylate synthase